MASAVIAFRFLRARRGWEHCSFVEATYRDRDSWLQAPKPAEFAVVDFLFHPGATLWADHHETTFIDSHHRLLRTDGAILRIYDQFSPSCAILLIEHLRRWYHYHDDRDSSLADGATKIDSAQYTDAMEAISGTNPAIILSKALQYSTVQYRSWILGRLIDGYLHDIASDWRVRMAYAAVHSSELRGLTLAKAMLSICDGGVAFLDFHAEDIILNRYSPYVVAPDARYSLTIERRRDAAKLTLMRNPWIDFVPPHLGRLCAPYGGGGHQRVGAIDLPASNTAKDVAASILRDLREAERLQTDS